MEDDEEKKWFVNIELKKQISIITKVDRSCSIISPYIYFTLGLCLFYFYYFINCAFYNCTLRIVIFEVD